MRKYQKAFAPLALLLLIAIPLFVFAVVYKNFSLYNRAAETNSLFKTPSPKPRTPSPKPTPTIKPTPTPTVKATVKPPVQTPVGTPRGIPNPTPVI